MAAKMATMIGDGDVTNLRGGGGVWLCVYVPGLRTQGRRITDYIV